MASPKTTTATANATALFTGQVRARMAANRFLRRLERQGSLTPEQLAAVNKVQDNGDAMDDFVAGLPAVGKVGVAMAAADGTPILDWLERIGKALWENREAILAFLMQLIKLFT